MTGDSLDDLFHELEAWEPTDIHITPLHDGEFGARGGIGGYRVAVVVRRVWEAHGETLDEALRGVLIALDTEG